MLAYSTIGFGALTSGVLMGNFIYLNNSLKSTGKSANFIPNRLKLLSLIFLTFSATSELMDRNMFFWGAGSLTLLGYFYFKLRLFGNFYFLVEGTKSRVVNIPVLQIFKFPCLMIALTSTFMFLTYYREKNRENTLVSEYKQREKFVNHIKF